MWNYVQPFAHTGNFMMGPNKSQKRDYGFHIPSTLHIAPGKTFSNPNFVNKQYPNVHNHHYVHHVTQKSQTDNLDKNSVHSLAVEDSNSMLIDKSADIVDHTEYHETNQDMYKRPKRSRRNRKRKATQKSTDRKRPDMDMNLNSPLETYMEVDNSRESSDSIKPDTYSDNISDLQNDGTSFKEVPSDTMLSTSPLRPSMRERQISVADSEDSFIVFQSGTDEELVFSESEDESIDQFEENDDSTVEEDLNSSSDIPYKKVRFAEDSDLCEVHRMVQWSYAYQQARKGPWEEYARDRDRFSKRIKDLENVLSPVFDSKHRESVYNERFKDKIVC